MFPLSGWTSGWRCVKCEIGSLVVIVNSFRQHLPVLCWSKGDIAMNLNSELLQYEKLWKGAQARDTARAYERRESEKCDAAVSGNSVSG